MEAQSDLGLLHLADTHTSGDDKGSGFVSPQLYDPIVANEFAKTMAAAFLRMAAAQGCPRARLTLNAHFAVGPGRRR